MALKKAIFFGGLGGRRVEKQESNEKVPKCFFLFISTLFSGYKYMKTHYVHIASDDYTKCFCIESHYFTTQLLTPHYHTHHVDEMQYQRKKQSIIVFLHYLHIAKAGDEIRAASI